MFVYQAESYRHWQAQLKRTDFVYGQFGENFTIEGMPDSAVCIGDRYRIGTAVCMSMWGMHSTSARRVAALFCSRETVRWCCSARELA